ncbi:partial two-component system, cell cycle sensor histidine kinase and response regulator CckA, partial [Rhodocyclaceae bacterium]
FNNLMGMVLGGLGLVAAKLPDDDKTRRHFEIARQAAKRAAEVTKSLLAVARKQPLTPRLIDVADALAEMMPLLQQSAGNATTVEESPCRACTAPEGCAACQQAMVDPAGLGNAILNLVINARDAMPAGGRIRIDTRVRWFREDDAGLPVDLAPGRYILVTVTDTGTGMPPEVAARAFEPFFTTKEKGKGTGLGLAMVYGFARQSGGTVSIHSQPGMGTAIRLYLPVAGPTTAGGAPADATPLPPGAGESILLVDDEAALLAITREWLEQLGYRPVVAHGPAVALDLLRSRHFDLLLTDIVMPGGTNGIVLAAEARRLQPDLRVLLASGFPGDLLPEGNVWPLLEKPYGAADLARMVRQALT